MSPRRLLDAATRPLHLVPPGLGVVAAGGLLVAGLPPLAIAVGALSLGAWAALTGWDLATPVPAPPEPDPVGAIRSPELRAQARSLLEASRRVRAHIDTHEGILDGALAEILAEERALIDAALLATRRGDAVWVLLRTVDPGVLRREIADRLAAADRATDRDVARSLRAAADAKQREMTTWQGLAGLVDRITAELVAADAALDELHARVVRVTMDDPGQLDEPDLRAQVGALVERFHRLERDVNETMKEVG